MAALKWFFESNGGRKVISQELVDFKQACTPAEYDAYVTEATRLRDAANAAAMAA